MEVFIMKLIKNLALFGTGIGIGGFAVCAILAYGIHKGDPIYEDDDTYVLSTRPIKDGTRLAMVFNKNTYEGYPDW